MSQTSFPSHTGPMARIINRLSSLFLATNGWMAPAPISKSSRRTNMVIMNATAMNQNVSILFSSLFLFILLGCLSPGQLRLLRLGLRSVGYLAHHEDEVQKTHDH